VIVDVEVGLPALGNLLHREMFRRSAVGEAICSPDHLKIAARPILGRLCI
jgi:hypothetical protein